MLFNFSATFNNYLKIVIKMSTIKTRCFLRCLDNLHDPISLPHNETIYVGRTPKTNIKDSNCSRKQVKLIADLEQHLVRATPLGVNFSGINGYCLTKDKSYTLRHKDRIEILLNKYIHTIEFDPPPSDYVETNNVKRRAEDSIQTNSTKKAKVTKLEYGRIDSKMGQWEEVDNKSLLIYTSEDVVASEKIAAYDMDSTIIRTKSGTVFAKDKNDWQLNMPEIAKTLQRFHADNYKIVFFTNQAGIASGKTKVADIKEKIEAVIKKIGIPIQVFVSTGKGIYRKPAPGMWNALSKNKNSGTTIDIEKSFYCGDAAGRENNWAPKKKKDHSVADRLFAMNVGVKFYTPEEHFLNARKMPFKMPEFDPRETPDLSLCEPPDTNIVGNDLEVVIMVGFPGSGKSSIAKTLQSSGYKHISRDALGTWQKCVAATEASIKNKTSAVIDNLNPDRVSRQKYLSVVKKYKVPCRCFVMKTSYHQSKHNNLFREITDKSHVSVGDMVFNGYKSKYEEPTKDEGFDAIVKINCIPKFDDPDLQQLYHMFLLEK